MKNSNIKNIIEEFWKIEQKNNVFNLEIKNIYYWQLVRFSVIREIIEKSGIQGQAHSRKDTTRDRLKGLISLFWNALMKNPLIGDYNKDILIFDHKRKIKIKNKHIDIYTHYLIKDIEKNNNINYEVIEFPYLRKHFTNQKVKNRKYGDIFILSKIIKRRTITTNFSADDIKSLRSLEEDLKNKFNINIDIINKVKTAILNFKLDFNLYSKLFNKRKPKVIYLVVSYGHEALIAAAKKCNIRVIEIQHGVITRYHPAYSFPHYRNELIYFPDEIFTFGQYWNESVQYPKSVQLTTYGFPFLKNQMKKYLNVVKKDNQILFLSQGTIGKELSEFAYQLALELSDYNIIYKLHPGEYDRWKKTYKSLGEATKLTNFKVIDNNEKSLYSYFAESKYQAGVYSTAIFEGLTFNCKTILVDLPGIEYMTDLIKEKMVKKVNTSDEFIKAMNSKNYKEFSKGYFFK